MPAIIDPHSHSLIDTLILKEGSSISFELVFVKGGSFMMGSDSEEAFNSEKPPHKVNVKDFYLGRCLVSQELWLALMGENRSFYQDPLHPAERVSWDDCQEFLSRLGKETGLSYRIPSEAEWEYAARGGSRSLETDYAGSAVLKEVGWYGDNSSGQTHFSTFKRGNELGICDMSGNLYEWCEDQWHGSYNDAPDDGKAWVDRQDAYRVLRGGRWSLNSEYCRVSSRYSTSPRFRDFDIGFRLALSPESVG